ncbi:MAG: hypothetical protein INR71_01320 [Terriglobus roseus]|nr:hypothetical protein [Terriglobus roseus]
MALLPSARQRLSADMNALLDSHPSLAASLEDFEHDDMRSRTSQSPMFGIPSQHSGFRDPSESEAESEPHAPWSPPAWRKESSGWYQRHAFSHSRSGSRELSPPYRDATSARSGSRDHDLTLARNIPLPASPEKMTPRSTVDPEDPEEEEDTQLANAPAKDHVSSRDTSMAPPDIPNNCKLHIGHRGPCLC